MTQAGRACTIKYVLAESSRWLLQRRRNTKKINIPGCREKYEKKKKRKVGSKAQKQAGKKNDSRRLHSNKSSRLCYKVETGTSPHHPQSSCSLRPRYEVSLLPLSRPPPPRTNERKPTKLPGLGGCSNSGSTY